DGREVKMVDVSPDGKISLSLFEGSSYIVVVETDPWGNKVECGMRKVDISSQPANRLRIVIDRKGRCDEKAFAKELDAGFKKKVEKKRKRITQRRRTNDSSATYLMFAHNV